jgi:hypothetical protein
MGEGRRVWEEPNLTTARKPVVYKSFKTLYRYILKSILFLERINKQEKIFFIIFSGMKTLT